jgi:hypothetical protein
MSESENLPGMFPKTMTQKPWGQAHPQRGAGHHDTASLFLESHPLGTQLRSDDFDRWAAAQGLLKLPQVESKQDDAWKAHLQRRHELRYRINKAGTHPRMETPFIIEAISFDRWEVRSPEVAISQNKILRQVERLTNTKKKHLDYLMQSADWSILPIHERVLAEALYDDIDLFQRQIELCATSLETKLARLQHKIRKGVESGAIDPVNSGIKRILEIEAEPDVEKPGEGHP